MWNLLPQNSDALMRRAFLEQAAASLLGVTVLPGAFAAAAESKGDAKPSAPVGPATTKNVIYIFMSGAMTHLDTFDLKPGRETQGETKGIQTAVSGLQISEFLPNLAKQMKHLAIIRSLTTETADHEAGRYLMQTAYKRIATIRHPGMGAWALHFQGKRSKTLPDNILIGGDAQHPGAGFMETSFTPVPIGDPNAGLQNTKQPDYLKEDSFERRMRLINTFDKGFREKYPQRQVEAYSEFYKQATTLMHSEDLKAFKLDEEKGDIRDKYGRNPLGQGLLLARRLVENNVRFVEVTSGGWDMHTNLWADNNIKARCATLDNALSALLTDLQEKGLLKQTMVVLTSEFGRTPRINENGGRDHHPGVFSGLFAGGGIKGGRFWGTSDADGVRPDKDRVDVADMNATIAYGMGLPLDKEVFSKSGRPFKVGHDGKPLTKLFS